MGFWGWAFLGTIGWGIWSAIPPDSCVRVHRAAAPVRAAGALIQFAVKNWADPQTNADLERQVASLSSATEEFAAQEFYGNGLKCRWGDGEHDVGFGQTAVDKQTVEQNAKDVATQAQSIAEGMKHGH